MIQPNYDLFLKILFVMFFIGAISNIIVGCLRLEKDPRYSYVYAIWGLIELALIIWMIL